MKKLLLLACLGVAACSPAAGPVADANSSTAVEPSALPPPASASANGSASGNVAQSAEIPAAFLGEWDIPPNPCDQTSDSRIVVRKDSIDFWESTGMVDQVTATDANDVTLALGMTGEGETWTLKMRMTLSADGKTLTTDTDTGQAVSRVRCPAKKL
jgi:hypothetical protein